MAFTRTEQRRITFLSLLSSASAVAAAEGGDAYGQASTWLVQMEEDGFFEEERAPARPTRAPSGRSDRPASSAEHHISSAGRPCRLTLWRRS